MKTIKNVFDNFIMSTQGTGVITVLDFNAKFYTFRVNEDFNIDMNGNFPEYYKDEIVTAEINNS